MVGYISLVIREDSTMKKSSVRFASLLIVTIIAFLNVASQSSKNGRPQPPGATEKKTADTRQVSPADASFDRPPLARPENADTRPQPPPDVRGDNSDEIKLAV